VWHALVDWDERVSGHLRFRGTAGSCRRLAILIAHVGDGWLWLLGWGVAYALGDETLRRGVLRWVAAALLAAGVVGATKLVLRRQRPTEAPGFYSVRYDAHSFPSGHAARMGVAAFLGPLVFPTWGWLGLPCALLVAWARVALGLHYVLDVAVGLSLGASAALAVCWL